MVVTDDEEGEDRGGLAFGQRLGPSQRERAEEEAKRRQREEETPESKLLDELRTEGRKRAALWQAFLEEQAKVLLGQGKPERSRAAYAWAARLSKTVLTEDFPDEFYEFLKFSIAEDIRPLNAMIADEAERALEEWRRGRTVYAEAIGALRQLGKIGNGEPTIASIAPEIMTEINNRLASYTKLITVPARRVARAFETARALHPAYVSVSLEENYARGLGDPTFHPSKDTKPVSSKEESPLLFLRATTIYQALGDPLGFLDAYQLPAGFDLLRDAPSAPLKLRPQELHALQAALYAALYLQMGFAQLNSPAKFERVAETLLPSAEEKVPPAKGWRSVRSEGFTGIREFVDRYTEPPPDKEKAWKSVVDMIMNLTAQRAEDIGKPLSETGRLNHGLANLFESLVQDGAPDSLAGVMIKTDAALIDQGKMTVEELARARLDAAMQNAGELNEEARKELHFLTKIDKDDPDAINDEVFQRVQGIADAIHSASVSRSEYKGLMAKVHAVRQRAADAMDVDLAPRKRQRGEEGEEDEPKAKRSRNEPSSAHLFSGEDVKEEVEEIRLVVANEVEALLLGAKMYQAGVLASAAVPELSPEFAARFDAIMILLGYQAGTPSLSKYVTPPGSSRKMTGSELPATSGPHFFSSMPSQERKKTKETKRSAVTLKKTPTRSSPTRREPTRRNGKKEAPPPPPVAEEKEEEQSQMEVDEENMSYWQTFIKGPEAVVSDLRKQFKETSTLEAVTITALTVGTSAAVAFMLYTNWRPFEGFGGIVMSSFTSAADKIGAISDADAGYVATSLGNANQWLNVVKVGMDRTLDKVNEIEWRTKQDLSHVKDNVDRISKRLGELRQNIVDAGDTLTQQVSVVQGIQMINQLGSDTAANGNRHLINGAEPTPAIAAPNHPPSTSGLAECDKVGAVLEGIAQYRAAAGGGPSLLTTSVAAETSAAIGARTLGCQLSTQDLGALQEAYTEAGLGGVKIHLKGEVRNLAKTVADVVPLPHKILGAAVSAELASAKIIEDPSAAILALRGAINLADEKAREIDRDSERYNRVMRTALEMSDIFMVQWKEGVVEQIRGSRDASRHAGTVLNALANLQTAIDHQSRRFMAPDYRKSFVQRSAAHFLNTKQAAINSFVLNSKLTNEQQTAYDNLLKQVASEPGSNTAGEILCQNGTATEKCTVASVQGHAQGTLAQSSHVISHTSAVVINALDKVPIANRFIPLANLVFIRSGTMDNVDLKGIAQGQFNASPASEYIREEGPGKYAAKTTEEILRDRRISNPTPLEYAEAAQRSIEAGRIVNAHGAIGKENGASSEQELKTLGSVAAAPLAMLMATTGLIAAFVDMRMYAGVAGSIGRIGALTGVAIETVGHRLSELSKKGEARVLRASIQGQDAAAIDSLSGILALGRGLGTGVLSSFALDLLDLVGVISNVMGAVGTGITYLSRLFLGISQVLGRYGEDLKRAMELGLALDAAEAGSKVALEIEEMRAKIAFLPRMAADALRVMHRGLDRLAAVSNSLADASFVLLKSGVNDFLSNTNPLMKGLAAGTLATAIGYSYLTLDPTSISTAAGMAALFPGVLKMTAGAIGWVSGRLVEMVVENKLQLGTILVSAIAVGLGGVVAYATIGMFNWSCLGMFGVRLCASFAARRFLRPMLIAAVDWAVRKSSAPGVEIERVVKDKKGKLVKQYVPAAELLKRMSPLRKFLFSGAYLAAEAGAALGVRAARDAAEVLAAKSSYLRPQTRFGRADANDLLGARTTKLLEERKTLEQIEGREKKLEERQLANTLNFAACQGGDAQSTNLFFSKTTGTNDGNCNFEYAQILRESLELMRENVSLAKEHAAALAATQDAAGAYVESLEEMREAQAAESVEKILEMTYTAGSDLLTLAARNAPLV